MNPFGTLEIKAKRELLKNEPPRKIKEICVLCKIDQIRILERKKKKEKEEEFIVPVFYASSQAKNRRLLPTNSCSADISAHDSAASFRLMTCKLMCSNCERMQPRSHPVETMRSGAAFYTLGNLPFWVLVGGEGGHFLVSFVCSQCVPKFPMCSSRCSQ